MCIPSPPSTPGQLPPPTQSVADNLQIGTSAVVQRNAGQIGRLALTSQGAAQKPSSIINTKGSPAGDTPTGQQSPSGTLALGGNYGQPYGIPLYGRGESGMRTP